MTVNATVLSLGAADLIQIYTTRSRPAATDQYAT
jgi:hypothetical protein